MQAQILTEHFESNFSLKIGNVVEKKPEKQVEEEK